MNLLLYMNNIQSFIIDQFDQVNIIQQMQINKEQYGLSRQYSQRNNAFNGQIRSYQKICTEKHKNQFNNLIKINKNKLPKDFFSKNQFQLKLQRKIAFSQDVSRQNKSQKSSVQARFNITPQKRNLMEKIEEKGSNSVFKLNIFVDLQKNMIQENSLFMKQTFNILPSKRFKKMTPNPRAQNAKASSNGKDQVSIKINFESSQNLNNYYYQQPLYRGRQLHKKQDKENTTKKPCLNIQESNKNQAMAQEINPQTITFYKAKSSILPPLKNCSLRIATKS